MKLKLSCASLTLIAVLILAASHLWAQFALRPAQASENVILRMSSPYPPGHPSTQAAEYFAGLVEQKTNARIRVQVFPNAELGSCESSLEQLQFGGIAFSVTPCLALPDGTCRADLPAGQPMQADSAALERLQMAVLAHLTPDYRCIANNSHPLYSGSDGAGLTLHSYDDSRMLEQLCGLGFSAVTLSSASLELSISHGYVDGAELAFMEYVSCEYYRILPYVSLFDGPRSPDLIVASRVTLGGLSVELQNIIADCAAAAEEYHMALLPQSQAEAAALLAQQKVALLPQAAQTAPPEEWERLRSGFVGAVQEAAP